LFVCLFFLISFIFFLLPPPFAFQVMVHPLGNYLFQRIIDHSNDAQINMILTRISRERRLQNALQKDSTAAASGGCGDPDDEWMDDAFKEYLVTCQDSQPVSLMYLLSFDSFGTRSMQKMIEGG
jgi:hypothetical protein